MPAPTKIDAAALAQRLRDDLDAVRDLLLLLVHRGDDLAVLVHHHVDDVADRSLVDGETGGVDLLRWGATATSTGSAWTGAAAAPGRANGQPRTLLAGLALLSTIGLTSRLRDGCRHRTGSDGWRRPAVTVRVSCDNVVRHGLAAAHARREISVVDCDTDGRTEYSRRRTGELGARASIDAWPRSPARLERELAKAIVGQQRVVREILIAFLAGGHCLLRGVPGLAKTLLIKKLAEAVAPQVQPHPVHARPDAVRHPRARRSSRRIARPASG